jgi:hypothetical protein
MRLQDNRANKSVSETGELAVGEALGVSGDRLEPEEVEPALELHPTITATDSSAAAPNALIG